MRLPNPDTETNEKKALETAEDVLEYDESDVEILIEYLIKLENNSSYIPSSREKAIGAANVLLHQGNSYWVNLIAVLQDINDNQYDQIIKQLYNWQNWDN
jgi:hypothetical protein